MNNAADRPEFRFALAVNLMPDSFSAWKSIVREAEETGFWQVVTGDHVGEERYASIPVFAAAAAVSNQIRFGTLVFNNDFRHPVLLAKDVATLDVVTDGRYELGLGAGWMTNDYVQTGIVKDPAGVRVKRLEESIRIIRALFEDGPVTFNGEHYQINELEGWPKPMQKPLPMFVGGGGQRLLTMAAQLVDVVGLQTVHHGGVRGRGSEFSRDAVAKRAVWVDEGARGRETPPDKHMLVFGVTLSDNSHNAAEALAPRFGLTADEALDSPYLLIGSVAQITEKLHRNRDEYGISYFSIRYKDSEDFKKVLAQL